MATCRGIDVSAFQGTQDWAAHRRDGVVFAFAKASEGQRSRDDRFVAHIRGIKNNGLVPGAYHFGWPAQDAAVEAANYIGAVRAYAGRGFCHWLDLERYPDGRNYRGQSNAEIRAWVTKWIALVSGAFPGQRVGVYTSASDLQAGHVPPGVPLWYPAYPWGAAPYSQAEAADRPNPAGRGPLFWQFTSQPIDRSICYLSAAQLRAWAAGTTEEDDVALTAEQAAQLAELHTVLTRIGSLTEKDTAGKPVVHGAGWYLAHLHYDALKTYAIENAQSAAIAQLASLIGSGVDTAAVVTAVQQAIADAVVKVDIDVTGPQAGG